MSLFPIFLKLINRPCLVVGAGQVGESKVEGLLAAGAAVKVVAPEATETVMQWARAGKIDWHPRLFEPADLDRKFLVVVATPLHELNDSIYHEAQRRGVLCNVVDDPPRCDFYYPAVVNRGKLQIAISTNGQSPALAQRLRRELEQQFGPEYGGWIKALGSERRHLLTLPLGAEERRQLLHNLVTPEKFEEFVRGTTRLSTTMP
ncbi:MAG: bifunctional precorrin-2 dehydrogenase/sirohydrochlorin ferrochelatase [Terriglobia bacterium]